MKKRHYVLTVMLLMCVSIFAQNRSNSEAIRIASDFLRNECGEVGRLSLLVKPKMALPGNNAALNSSFVVNDEDNGRFVIVSADERMLPILGFSDNGTFELKNMPAGLIDMLNSYELQYQYLVQHPDKVTMKTVNVTTPVTPLIQTAWGQHEPYNDECPASGEKCVTGCIATSMAQIMNYHQYPQQCQGGTYSYTSTSLSFYQELNYNNITFDWSKMLNSFSSSSPAENKAEIAKLLHACGVSVSMDYGLDGSGASDVNIPYALKTYFGYGSDVTYKERAYYSSEEWDRMIMDDLNANRPIFYGGNGSTGGHSFILDGVNESGYYHFNFGWYGLGDGYYALDAVEPKPNQDTYDFNNEQSMVCKVAPESFGEQKEDIFYGSTFTCGSSSVNVNSRASFTFSALCYSSNSTSQEQGIGGFNGEMGLALYDNEFNYIKSLTSITVNDLNCCSGFTVPRSVTLSSSDFKDGNNYFIAMYVKSTEAATPTIVHFTWGNVQCFNAKVESGVVTLTPKYNFLPDYNLTVSDAGISSMYLDHAVTLPDDPDLLGVFYVFEVNNNVMNMRRIRNVIPANTGVIIMANPGTLTFEPCTEDVESITDNLLLGTTEPLARTDVDGTVYTLGRGVNSGYVGFHKYTGNYIPANKCYYVRDNDANVNAFSLNMDGTTDIMMAIDHSDAPSVIYDLQGRRVDVPTHGIYIINGRKVLVK